MALYRPATAFLSLFLSQKELGRDPFADPVAPASFPKGTLRYRNTAAAEEVGLDTLSPEDWEAHFLRFSPLPGTLPQPLALRYHGHQFQHYNPNLGDGRGFLFAQLYDYRGRLMDLGTKGSGPTPYARGGDGRLTLKGGVREVLAASLLAARGVDTCRILSLFETGESLWRHDEPSPARSSVLVRLSWSHLRFGTFQRLAWARDRTQMEALLAYAVAHYYPSLQGSSDLPAAFLRAVAVRSARTVARWMAAGFVHGVLNTDNMNITGESFDYGPWRFLPRLDPGFTAAYFDDGGLYAYGNQAAAVRWNLDALAQALSLIAGASRASLTAALEVYEPSFRRALAAALRERLGLAPMPAAEEQALADAVLVYLEQSRCSFDGFFFENWGGQGSGRLEGPSGRALRGLLERAPPAPHAALAAPYLRRPRPCGLEIEEVEAIWSCIAEADQWQRFTAKIQDIAQVGALLTPTGSADSILDQEEG